MEGVGGKRGRKLCHYILIKNNKFKKALNCKVFILCLYFRKPERTINYQHLNQYSSKQDRFRGLRTESLKFFPSTFACILKIKLRSSSLYKKHLYSTRHLQTPDILL